MNDGEEFSEEWENPTKDKEESEQKKGADRPYPDTWGGVSVREA